MNYKWKRGFSALELSICVFLIGLFIVIGTFYYHKLITQAKEVVLETELRNLRANIAFFDSQKKVLPDDLGELERTRLSKFSLLQVSSRDGEGYPLDPFGNRYKYDSRTGEVHSQTKRYENW